MSEYRLILVSDNSNSSRIRYRKKDDRTWNTIYLEEGDFDSVINKLLSGLDKNEQPD